jgi:hypothetical protein
MQIRAFVDKLIENHMAMKPAVEPWRSPELTCLFSSMLLCDIYRKSIHFCSFTSSQYKMLAMEFVPRHLCRCLILECQYAVNDVESAIAERGQFSCWNQEGPSEDCSISKYSRKCLQILLECSSEGQSSLAIAVALITRITSISIFWIILLLAIGSSRQQWFRGIENWCLTSF